MSTDPRDEARARTGGRFDVRVLEPSPEGYREPPWFADDPVQAPVSGERPVVSPVGNGDRTWDALAGEEPALRSWCADRWLGAWRRLTSIADVPTFVATRGALHAVAEHLLAPARHGANGRIGLRSTRGGFGTPFFDRDGRPTQLRVEGTDLVVTHADGFTHTPLGALASDHTRRSASSTPAPGLDLGYPTATEWSEEVVGRVDEGAAAQLADWFGFATSVLEEVRAVQPDRDDTRVQLWPEHFDLSIELGDEASGSRGTLGASPGDDAHAEPYLYVTHWAPVSADPFWNDGAFAGASLPYPDVVAATDQRGVALAFFRRGLDVLAGAS